MKAILFDDHDHKLVSTNVPNELYLPEFPLESLAAVDMHLAKRMYDHDPTAIRPARYHWAVKLITKTIMAIGKFGKINIAIAFGPMVDAEIPQLQQRVASMPLDEAWRLPVTGIKILDLDGIPK